MVRIAQVGTGHGHALGKWRALCANADVEAVGIYESESFSRNRPESFDGARWFPSLAAIFDDPTIDAVAVEVRNHASLPLAAQAVAASKHVWFDKPAGDDWPGFVELMRQAAERRLHVQMGYMFRYSPGFEQVTSMARSGELGEVFAVRAHMSTNVGLAERREQSRHLGGILYDLGGHMLDQMVWLLGEPVRVSTTLRNDATPHLPEYADNTVCVLEFPHALAVLDIAAMEARPAARRFEVYGAHGSAVLQPFDPVRTLRVARDDSERVENLEPVERQTLYERELAAFVGVLRGERAPDRPAEHDLIVQRTLLRSTGRLSD
ncbi:MAG: Gfo/Idh/MocA family oxidoreductase [Chloroflexi bacterium]|nr:Gfo/Idh/MocA family oxidoreductase [Chloroflexota bacterium]